MASPKQQAIAPSANAAMRHLSMYVACVLCNRLILTRQVPGMMPMLQAGSMKGDPNDSDEDMVLGAIEFTLRCPLTGSRIKTPARFAGVPGLTAFDLDAFMGMVKRSKKWQCPHSMRNLPVQELMIDGYLSRILPRLQVLTGPH